MDLARYSGIETAVFFSDACRSIPQTAQEQRIEGVDGSPNLSDFDVPNKVDAFKATSDAQSAYEIPLALEPGEPLTCRSVLTTAWLAAYEEASADMDSQAQPTVTVQEASRQYNVHVPAAWGAAEPGDGNVFIPLRKGGEQCLA